MEEELDGSPTTEPTPRRRRRLTIGSIILLIAVIACGLAAYREHVKNANSLVVSYPVGDLIPATNGRPDFGPLIASLNSNVSPSSWKGQGGKGTITPFFLNQSLIIRNSPRVHEHIKKFLQTMQKVHQDGEAGYAAPRPRPKGTPPAPAHFPAARRDAP